MVNFTNRGGWRRLLPVLMIVAIIAGCAGYRYPEQAGRRAGGPPGTSRGLPVA